MTDINLTYRFFVEDGPSADDGFRVLLFHEILYDAPKRLNFRGWFGDRPEIYDWMRQATKRPHVQRNRPLTWPRMTVSRSGSRDLWTVQIEGHPALSGYFGLRSLFG
jgi:hypothetical protein